MSYTPPIIGFCLFSDKTHLFSSTYCMDDDISFDFKWMCDYGFGIPVIYLTHFLCLHKDDKSCRYIDIS